MIGLSFDDLSIDDNLSDLSRIKRYVVSKVEAQRLAHVKMLCEISKDISYDIATTEIFPLFDVISNDVQSIIRSQLAIELKKLTAEFYHEHAELLEIVLPICNKLLRDEDNEVNISASSIFIEIFKHVDKDLVFPKLLPSILTLAHNEEDINQREIAVLLLSQLAFMKGSEIMDVYHQFILPEFKALSEDQSFRVRRATTDISPFVNLSFDFILDVFQNLVGDPVWSVRRSCAGYIAKSCTALNDDEESKMQFLPFVQALLNDQNNFVRENMFLYLGLFLAELKCPPDSLLIAYGKSNPSVEAASSLARVAVVSGKDKWTFLAPLAINIASCRIWQIETALAKHIGKLVIVCGVQQTCDLIELLKTDIEANWRLRFALATQLPTLLEVFDTENSWNVLAPMCFTLLDDSVKVVGKAAMKSLGVLYTKFSGERKSQISSSLIERHNRRRYGYDVRQQFVWVVSALLESLSKDEFCLLFLKPLLSLVHDPVPNVRIAVASVLSQPAFRDLSKDIPRAIEVLKADKEIDVSNVL